ncbi:MFS transporter [Streptomyces sp. NPDC006656]|uniref:MFS transporter n=1 Tax=Streptomyces sp. NPDC006656 TaxID=3156899 RepID=UPI00345476F1
MYEGAETWSRASPPAAVARASIQTDTGAGTAALQWFHAAYVLAFALRLITGGRLGDLYGRRRIILTGTAVFTLPCPLCGIAAGPELLIAACVVQGAAAAAMVPQGPGHPACHLRRGLPGEGVRPIRDGHVARQCHRPGPGRRHGPGRPTCSAWGWRPDFLINLPIGIAAVVLGLRLLPESRERTAHRLDPLGLLLITRTVGGEHGWPPWSLAALAVGPLVLAVFVAQQRAKTRRDGSPPATSPPVGVHHRTGCALARGGRGVVTQWSRSTSSSVVSTHGRRMWVGALQPTGYSITGPGDHPATAGSDHAPGRCRTCTATLTASPALVSSRAMR